MNIPNKIMIENPITLRRFEDGLYPDMNYSKYQPFKEEQEIRNFLNDCITRANRYKEEEHKYPSDMEEVIAWEEYH